mmetsp:Transcript_29957/g.39386  ORF Transcript_29957/g.39386 Transcript_29957/m.39386 type:complete len:404 (-) Transcript_29957:167-1378(-)
MGKHDFLTPKAIANRQKAKGLQKLRWYCQMCQKQCRDENGFKCHLTSEGHMRQMRIFSENGDKIMDSYSEQFEEDFLEVLSRRHGTKRVRAVAVYNEFIADRHHVHMNSTKWETLTNFVKYLGKKGLVVCDQTEKGWYIQWIDRDPETLRRQAELERRKKADMDDEEKQLKLVLQRVEAAQASAKEDESKRPTELSRTSEEEKLRLGTLGVVESSKKAHASKKRSLPTGFAFGGAEPARLKKDDSAAKPSSKMSALDKIIMEDKKRKEAAQKREEETSRKDYWLHKGIIVKVLNKKIRDGKYYKKKARVSKVIEKYVGEVVMLDSGDRLRIDQEQLETVVPTVGGSVRILNGRCRGSIAKLVDLDISNFCASLRILDDGPHKGDILEKVEYEDFSKIHEKKMK